MKKCFNVCFYFLLISLGFSSISCKKDDDFQLPAETQSGKNTFGCKVNGGIWLPETDDFKSNIYSAKYSSKKGIYIFAQKDNKSGRTYFQFELDSLKKPIIGDLRISIQHGLKLKFVKVLSTSDQIYSTDSMHTGNITFTRFDTVAKIMSGRFEFEAKQEGGTATVKVTEGRFDFKYQNKE